MTDTIKLLVCSLCGWKGLREDRALVPDFRLLTENRYIPITQVVLEDHACCRRCVETVGTGDPAAGIRACPEARFYSFRLAKNKVAELKEREVRRQAQIAEYEAEQAQKAAEQVKRIAEANAEAESFKKTNRRQRREAEKMRRDMVAARNAKRTEILRQMAS